MHPIFRNFSFEQSRMSVSCWISFAFWRSKRWTIPFRLTFAFYVLFNRNIVAPALWFVFLYLKHRKISPNVHTVWISNNILDFDGINLGKHFIKTKFWLTGWQSPATSFFTKGSTVQGKRKGFRKKKIVPISNARELSSHQPPDEMGRT